MREPLASLLQETARHRHLIRNFVTRDLKVKYRGTVAGYLWSLLEPLSLVAIYYFVFVVIANRGGENYALVVVLGVFPFNLFSGIMNGGALALVSNAHLIRRIYLPRIVFIVSLVASNYVVFVLSLLAVIPFLFMYGVNTSPTLLWFPVAMLMMGMFATGIGMVASCANVIFKDVGYVLRVALRLGFYGCPAIYPVSMVPENIREIYLFNPVSVYIHLGRIAITGAPLLATPAHIVSAAAFACISMVVGAVAFDRWEKRAVKFL